MFANIFGNYLLEKNVIETQQYESIKATQAKTRVKLGLIAVAEKLMTQKEADAVNMKQLTMDRRFGDIAVEMGYLTKEQVKHLLGMQGNPYIQFVQAVTDLGYMTIEDVERELLAYQKEKGFTSMDMDAVKSGDIDRVMPLLLPEDMPWTVAEHVAVMMRTLNRLACDDISILKPKYIDIYVAVAYAMQSMYGDFEAGVAISGSKEGMLAIASGFAKEKFESLDYEAMDSIGEYINIGNGLFATSISHEGTNISLCPPDMSEEGGCLKSERMCLIPLKVEGYLVDFIISPGVKITVE